MGKKRDQEKKAAKKKKSAKAVEKGKKASAKAEVRIEGRTCPLLQKKSCPLANPKCGKGKALRKKLLQLSRTQPKTREMGGSLARPQQGKSAAPTRRLPWLTGSASPASPLNDLLQSSSQLDELGQVKGFSTTLGIDAGVIKQFGQALDHARALGTAPAEIRLARIRYGLAARRERCVRHHGSRLEGGGVKRIAGLVEHGTAIEPQDRTFHAREAGRRPGPTAKRPCRLRVLAAQLDGVRAARFAPVAPPYGR